MACQPPETASHSSITNFLILDSAPSFYGRNQTVFLFFFGIHNENKIWDFLIFKDLGPCDCGSTVGKNPNPVVHQILKDLPIFCSHYKRGCRDFFAQNEDLINYYQQGCSFREVYCPYLGGKCEEKILFKDVISHLNQKHRFSCSISYGSKFTEMLPTNCLTDLSAWLFKKPIRIKNGTIFFLAGLVNDKFANFWIYGLLSPLETKVCNFLRGTYWQQNG